MATTETPATSNGSAGAEGVRDTIDVENPATGQIVGSVPHLTPDDVAEQVTRGRRAQPGWEALGFAGRARVLKRAQSWLVNNSDRVIETICSETGKTWEDGALEISYGASAFGFWAKNAEKYLAEETIKTSSPLVMGKKLKLRYRPLGLVGVIGPWNYPLVNSFGDCIPALAAGNSVILKPSEVTPLTSLLLAEALEECGLPRDVYQVATGLGDTGSALVDGVDYLMFTGSTATGKKVAQRAAENLIPCGLELGGKDPMIVLEGADLERAANAATYYSMQNAGQTCISVERLYVQEPVYDEFVQMVTGKVKELRQGHSTGPGTAEVGAVTFEKQAGIIEDHVKDAVDKGAKVLTGGKAGPGPGRFYEPTVLVDVDHSMKCMTEETFGPTLPIMKVKDADEAVKLANDTPYGLQASVWASSVEDGEKVARRIDAGAANVNEGFTNYLALEAPMGGWKDSGIGTRHGAGGIRKYCHQQAQISSSFGMKKELFMFPYSPRMTKFLGRVTKLINGRGKAH